MTEKLTWNAHLHCVVVVLNDTAMRVPRILNPGGCMRPPHRLLVLQKMFGYDKFEIICRRKYKTIEVISVIKSEESKDRPTAVSLLENSKFFSTLGYKNGKFWAANP